MVIVWLSSSQWLWAHRVLHSWSAECNLIYCMWSNAWVAHIQCRRRPPTTWLVNRFRIGPVCLVRYLHLYANAFADESDRTVWGSFNKLIDISCNCRLPIYRYIEVLHYVVWKDLLFNQVNLIHFNEPIHAVYFLNIIIFMIRSRRHEEVGCMPPPIFVQGLVLYYSLLVIGSLCNKLSPCNRSKCELAKCYIVEALRHPWCLI